MSESPVSAARFGSTVVTAMGRPFTVATISGVGLSDVDMIALSPEFLARSASESFMTCAREYLAALGDPSESGGMPREGIPKMGKLDGGIGNGSRSCGEPRESAKDTSTGSVAFPRGESRSSADIFTTFSARVKVSQS